MSESLGMNGSIQDVYNSNFIEIISCHLYDIWIIFVTAVMKIASKMSVK